jgi:hemerythrin-like domain-containing protein
MAEEGVLSFGTVMVFIHTAITRGLVVTVERGSEILEKGYPDPDTQAGFALFVSALISVVRGHHMSEDEVAFPHLREKLSEVPFDKLMADHRVMDGLLDELEEGVGAVRAEAQAGSSLAALIGTATALSDLWHPHIQIEEDGIYAADIIAAIMDADEDAQLNQRLAAYAQAHVQPLSIGMPFLIYNLPREERDVYTAAMPPMVTEQLVPVTWKEEWAPMQPFLLE